MKVIATCILIVSLISSGCGFNGCESLPATFASYEEAIEKVQSATFSLSENQDTDRSSWIQGAEFYSCDGQTGYLILRTDDGEYIHDGVPVGVWRDFQNASSYGSFYNANVRGRYRLKLN